jgi:hypothetical protein
MEPKLPAPNFQPEQQSVSYEQSTDQSRVSTPEIAPGGTVERVEQRSEGTPSMATPVLPLPIMPAAPAPASPSVTSQSASQDGLPLVAADEDLIEKEWVDKAKKIIEVTKDDPYRREQEVGKLQADYLRKRYGKELGAS